MRRARSKTHSAASEPRRPRRIHDEAHDVYGTAKKLPDGTACPRCAASYREGRWTWERPLLGSPEHLCPACRRIEDDYPAGVVAVRGAFAAAHREEIESLIRHVEEHAKQEHPLKRIFAILEEDGGLRVPTTDARLAREIGEALYRAYRGELEQPAPQTEGIVRVSWQRE